MVARFEGHSPMSFAWLIYKGVYIYGIGRVSLSLSLFVILACTVSDGVTGFVSVVVGHPRVGSLLELWYLWSLLPRWTGVLRGNQYSL